GVGSGGYAGSRFQRLRCLANDGIFERISCDLPHRNESIDCLGKAYGEDAMIACGAERFEIQIERTTEAIRTKEHEHIQPVERIDEAEANVHVMLQAISVIDIEVPQLAR